MYTRIDADTLKFTTETTVDLRALRNELQAVRDRIDLLRAEPAFIPNDRRDIELEAAKAERDSLKARLDALELI